MGACGRVLARTCARGGQDTTLLNVLGSVFLFVSVIALLWRLGRQYGTSYAKANTLSLGVDTANLSVRASARAVE